MKKTLFFSIVSAAMLLAVSCGNVKDFVFVQITDTQVGFMDRSEHFTESDSLLKDAVDAINRIKPSCVILTGDLTNDYKNEEQWAIYNKRMGEINPKIPVYITPGNHDIPEFNDGTLAAYIDRIGYDRFSFVQNKCAFIGFDSCRIKSNDSAAEQEQFEWLKGELEKAQGSRHIFVFFHCPIVYHTLDEEMNNNSFPVELRQKYLSLFLDSNVDAVFTGHTHNGVTIDLNGLKSINVNPVGKAFGKGGSGLNVVKVTKDGFESSFCTGKEILENWTD